MWLYRTSRDTDRPIVLYDYQPGRGACYPKAFLKVFKGYLHTDGYDVYHSLPDEVTVVGRWAHARRKFDEAMKSLPKGKAKSSSAAQGLAYCNLLFKIEDALADLSPKERYDQRLEQAKPVLDALLAWANTRTAAPKSSLMLPDSSVPFEDQMQVYWNKASARHTVQIDRFIVSFSDKGLDPDNPADVLPSFSRRNTSGSRT